MLRCILFVSVLTALILIASCQGKKGMEYVGAYAIVFEIAETDDEEYSDAVGFQTLVGHLTLDDDQTYELLFLEQIAGKWEFKGDHILLRDAGKVLDSRAEPDLMLRIVDGNTLELIDEAGPMPELRILFVSSDQDE